MKSPEQLREWYFHCKTAETVGVGVDGVALNLEINSVTFAVIASWGGGWDHVSVSLPNRCPIWPEMDFIKSVFWHPNEVVMQLHITSKRKINVHPYCLHMWKPQTKTIPLPPRVFV